MVPFSVISFQSQAFSIVLLRLLVGIFIFHGLCHARTIKIPRADLDEENALEFDLLKRQVVVPSVPYIRQKVIDGGQMDSKVSIFWSGFEPPMDGYQAAKSYGKQMFGCDRAVLYDEALPSEDYVYFQSADENNPPTVEQNMQKIQVMSAVFAQTTTGTAYVLLQDGKQFNPSSTWTLYEYPNLTAGISTVKEIILIYWPSLTQESLWKKGKGQQGVWPPVGADRSIFAG